MAKFDIMKLLSMNDELERMKSRYEKFTDLDFITEYDIFYSYKEFLHLDSKYDMNKLEESNFRLLMKLKFMAYK